MWLRQLDPMRLFHSMYSRSPGVDRGANAQTPPERTLKPQVPRWQDSLYIFSVCLYETFSFWESTTSAIMESRWNQGCSLRMKVWVADALLPPPWAAGLSCSKVASRTRGQACFTQHWDPDKEATFLTLLGQVETNLGPDQPLCFAHHMSAG